MPRTAAPDSPNRQLSLQWSRTITVMLDAVTTRAGALSHAARLLPRREPQVRQPSPPELVHADAALRDDVMRQISNWRCDIHPANQKTIISAARTRAPICDWQTPETDSWPCSRSMVLFSPSSATGDGSPAVSR